MFAMMGSMLIYPEINPVACTILGFPIYWYGITYLVGLILCYGVLLKTAKPPFANKDLISDLIFYAAIGIIFGGRIGYILFYFPGDILTHPLSLFYFFAPGRSFHGGFLGVIIAMYFFAKKYKLPYLKVTDFIAPVVPLGLACGRIGNFINGELWGRVVTREVPWAMVFPSVDSQPRHPSQLYQFLLEGLLLFIILQLVNKKAAVKQGLMSGAFCIGYGIMRIIGELFREPDASHGFIWGLTMGHILSLPLVALGLYLLFKGDK